VAAVLDATTDLMAEFGPDAVSLRMIAARANVNYGLIQRHFGSREALLEQAVDTQMTTITAKLRERGFTPATALQILAEHPLLTDLVLRAALARTDMRVYRPQNSIVQRLLRPEGNDPSETPSREQRLRVAAFVAFIFGWVALENMSLTALGFDDDEREAVRIEVAEYAPDPGVVDFD
jgi:AcrR family transcriptional regulator